MTLRRARARTSTGWPGLRRSPSFASGRASTRNTSFARFCVRVDHRRRVLGLRRDEVDARGDRRAAAVAVDRHRLPERERRRARPRARRSAPWSRPGGSSDTTGWPAGTHSPTRKKVSATVASAGALLPLLLRRATRSGAAPARCACALRLARRACSSLRAGRCATRSAAVSSATCARRACSQSPRAHRRARAARRSPARRALLAREVGARPARLATRACASCACVTAISSGAPALVGVGAPARVPRRGAPRLRRAPRARSRRRARTAARRAHRLPAAHVERLASVPPSGDGDVDVVALDIAGPAGLGARCSRSRRAASAASAWPSRSTGVQRIGRFASCAGATQGIEREVDALRDGAVAHHLRARTAGASALRPEHDLDQAGREDHRQRHRAHQRRRSPASAATRAARLRAAPARAGPSAARGGAARCAA